MKRDTQRIEEILSGLKAVRARVREEIAAGVSFQQMHDQLLAMDVAVTARLKELQAWNAAQPAEARAEEKNIKPRSK